jgi:hypothetical protein
MRGSRGTQPRAAPMVGRRTTWFVRCSNCRDPSMPDRHGCSKSALVLHDFYSPHHVDRTYTDDTSEWVAVSVLRKFDE